MTLSALSYVVSRFTVSKTFCLLSRIFLQPGTFLLTSSYISPQSKAISTELVRSIIFYGGLLVNKVAEIFPSPLLSRILWDVTETSTSTYVWRMVTNGVVFKVTVQFCFSRSFTYAFRFLYISFTASFVTWKVFISAFAFIVAETSFKSHRFSAVHKATFKVRF